ncbi:MULTISPECIES: glutaminase [unclassified Ekhidna]|jgi:glutaminase|uniref:glutaminase n=1 Tax=unclassified Ekhidna TaxID=2632188 RepID=UPI0032E03538
MDYQGILNVIEDQLAGEKLDGEVATYIPELAKVKPEKLGMHLTSVIGEEFHFGDSEERFSIQSITKVLSLALALLKEKDEVIWERVDVEPSGDPFNSLVQLEYENGIPRNPLINSGALVICDILVTHLQDPKKEYLDFVRHIAGNSTIDYNEKVAASEKEQGFNNRAMINLMKGYENIHNDVEEVLDFYFDTCSLSMSCRELAQTFLMFANQGKLLKEDEKVLSEVHTKRINAIMQTCGFYDEAGEFSFRVGLPGKSGVGGGIVAVYPNMYSVAVWSPKLNEKGNSTAGMRALELLTEITGSSIF